MNESLMWLIGAAAAGSFLPKLLAKYGFAVPALLMPGGSPAAPKPADAAPSLKIAYEWAVNAAAGLVEPTAEESRLCRAIKPHLDALVAGRPSPAQPMQSLADLKLK